MEVWKEELYSTSYGNDLRHYGIEGQKWGIRRYQNKDGTLTEEGKRRYGEKATDDMERISNLMDDYSSIKKENRGLSDGTVRGAASTGLLGAYAALLFAGGDIPIAAVAASSAAITAGLTMVSGIMAAKGKKNLNWVKKELAKNGVDSKDATIIDKDYVEAMRKTAGDYSKGRIDEMESLKRVESIRNNRNRAVYEKRK